MKQIILSAPAKLDLLNIWDYISEDSSETTADNFIDRITEKFCLLATQPEMGRQRPELQLGLRSHAVFNYIIFYRISDSGLEIVRVLHGSRDIDNLL